MCLIIRLYFICNIDFYIVSLTDTEARIKRLQDGPGKDRSCVNLQFIKYVCILHFIVLLFEIIINFYTVIMILF